jgi:hypothetical protein
MTAAGTYWAPGGRHDRNEASRDAAANNRDGWTQDELELLITWDRSEEELTTMGEILGRTREACRVKYYLAIGADNVTVMPRQRTDPTPVYSNWSDEDRSPWYV